MAPMLPIHLPPSLTTSNINTYIEITCLPSQNNEKVVLVVARRKGNYASSQSTAITAQRDETDGAVPGPQSSGKVVVGKLFLVFRIFLKTDGRKFRDSN